MLNKTWFISPNLSHTPNTPSDGELQGIEEVVIAAIRELEELLNQVVNLFFHIYPPIFKIGGDHPGPCNLVLVGVWNSPKKWNTFLSDIFFNFIINRTQIIKS